MNKFDSERDFELKVIEKLACLGWTYEQDLKDLNDLKSNFCNKIFKLNRSLLNDIPFNDEEQEQLFDFILSYDTYELQKLITQPEFDFIRTNKKDKRNYDHKIQLKLFDNNNSFQVINQLNIIADDNYRNRRGDLTLLINGLPFLHIELKKSDAFFDQSIGQISKYIKENKFNKLLKAIRVFVGMTPNKAKYFSNPCNHNDFNNKFVFHWSDKDNRIINSWDEFCTSFLEPQKVINLVKDFTVVDKSNKKLQVMRSYQIHALNSILNAVNSYFIKENVKDGRGGYIWHTTGSGKTFTSFKTADIISRLDYDVKVVFVVDRIELGQQTIDNFNNMTFFNKVAETKDYKDLGKKLLESNSNIVVTSIQKLNDLSINLHGDELKEINSRNYIFIFDECHRSTFGDMLINIKSTFTKKLIFGFTGTPIFEENSKRDSTTEMIFGDLLHSYKIKEAIEDRNVLEFSYSPVQILNNKSLIECYARKIKGYKEGSNEYFHFINSNFEASDYIDIETKLTATNFDDEHKRLVIDHILDNFSKLSFNHEFHMILATDSISDAIKYFKLIKVEVAKRKIQFNFTPIFSDMDSNDFNKHNYEEDKLEILEHYNNMFKDEAKFTLSNFERYITNVRNRLAHRRKYKKLSIDKSDEQLDLVIVVEQLLTGFDSKWINTLFLDKVLKMEHLIQAFSRTNRVYNDNKMYGNIFFYRKINTMEKNIHDALKKYSNDNENSFSISKLESNIDKCNEVFENIDDIFKSNNIPDYIELPSDEDDILEFQKLFKNLDKYYKICKVQGLDENDDRLNFDENIFICLKARFKDFEDFELENEFKENPNKVFLKCEKYPTYIEAKRVIINSGYFANREVCIQDKNNRFYLARLSNVLQQIVIDDAKNIKNEGNFESSYTLTNEDVDHIYEKNECKKLGVDYNEFISFINLLTNDKKANHSKINDFVSQQQQKVIKNDNDITKFRRELKDLIKSVTER